MIKKKHFISACSTSIPGNPRKTKHYGEVAEEYLKFASSIDIFNHFRTGALCLNDMVKTHSPHLRQACGILDFIFSKFFLAHKSCKPGQSNLTHGIFKINLTIAYGSTRTIWLNCSNQYVVLLVILKFWPWSHTKQHVCSIPSLALSADTDTLRVFGKFTFRL